MFEAMIETLKANPRKIVFTEGHDARILEAASRLKKDGFLTPILVGNVDVVKENAAKGGFDIEGLEILDPLTYPEMDAMVEKMVELRKGKMTAEDCAKALSKGNYFGTMLVKMGKADALLGGATYSTADTVRPALQLIKTKKGAHLVSSAFILTRPGDDNLSKICMGDCAINISYEDSVDKEAGRGGRGVRQDRGVLRHRPQGRHAELLHQGLRQGRHRGSLRRGHQGCQGAGARPRHRRRDAV